MLDFFYPKKYNLEKFLEKQGGIHNFHKRICDFLIENGLKLVEVGRNSLQFHYGNERGKIGIQLEQKDENSFKLYVAEQMRNGQIVRYETIAPNDIENQDLLESINETLPNLKIQPLKKVISELDNFIEHGGKIYTIIEDLKKNDGMYSTRQELANKLFILAYQTRISVLERYQNNSWSHTTKIKVPHISRELISIGDVIELTVNNLLSYSQSVFLNEGVQEILMEKGELYYKVEKLIPEVIRNQM